MNVAIDFLSSNIDSIARQADISPLVGWSGFYVITGSAAGALTGLMFVVIALIAGNREHDWSQDLATYGTPTVVHFSAVLLFSLVLSVPWQSLSHVAVVLSLVGLAGVIYAAIVLVRFAQRARRQDLSPTSLGNWLWYAVIPLVAYTTLVGTAVMLPGSPVPALFGIGAAMVLLLFLGIHNAWDTVIYLAVERFKRDSS